MNRSIPSDSAVIGTYHVATALPLEQAAAVIAGEQSCGTFVRVRGESDALRARYGATVERIDEVVFEGRAPLPGTTGDWSGARQARVRIRFPLHNFGPSIPNLLTTLAGNLYELRELGELKLMDVELPAAFGEAYPGPQFGVAGTKRIIGREKGPCIGTIIKPSVGLGPEELGRLVEQLALSGIDFIKDDELQANSPAFPLADRVPVVMDALQRAADRIGTMPLYAFNITDDIDNLQRNHDLVQRAGGNCVMVAINSIGLSGLYHLRQRCALPIHGHRAMFGAFDRSPQIGISFRVFQKLARLAGTDHIHTNGIANKFYESDANVIASIAAVREPLLGGNEAMPVLSSGQTPGIASRTHDLVGHADDLLVLAGGGIHAHPAGAPAGVTAMREAWDAAVSGESLQSRAARSAPLQQALATFGAPA